MCLGQHFMNQGSSSAGLWSAPLLLCWACETPLPAVAEFNLAQKISRALQTDHYPFGTNFSLWFLSNCVFRVVVFFFLSLPFVGLSLSLLPPPLKLCAALLIYWGTLSAQSPERSVMLSCGVCNREILARIQRRTDSSKRSLFNLPSQIIQRSAAWKKKNRICLTNSGAFHSGCQLWSGPGAFRWLPIWLRPLSTAD